MTRIEIPNGWAGPIIVHATPTGTVALSVSQGHPDDGRVSATAYLDRDQASQLVAALVRLMSEQWPGANDPPILAVALADAAPDALREFAAEGKGTK